MVEVNELRIGSRVLINGKTEEVNAIGPNVIWYNGIKIVKCFSKPKIEIPTILNCNIEDVKPIELTEEILFKCGFKEDDLFYHKDDIIISNFYEDFLTLDGYNCSKIRYLHQLQNLYFALTNQELNIEL